MYIHGSGGRWSTSGEKTAHTHTPRQPINRTCMIIHMHIPKYNIYICTVIGLCVCSDTERAKKSVYREKKK